MKSARRPQTTKSEIIEMHKNKGSDLWAPKLRHGENPLLKHEVIDVHCRYLKRFHGLEILEKHIADVFYPDFYKSGYEFQISKPKKPELCLRKFREKVIEEPKNVEIKSLTLRVPVPPPTPEPSIPKTSRLRSDSEENLYQASLLLGKLIKGSLKQDKMNPSRYMLIDERSPYPVKRRVRGQRNEKGSEPTITLLPPDPYMIMERPGFVRSSTPTMYRTVPPKSAKNREASSFVILGETMKTPVQSRPGSPSGRVSPFRGHGFKSPTTTRPNSRAPSPSDSPKKILPSSKLTKSTKPSEKPRVSRDIGLPPKSPMKSKPKTSEVKTSAANSEKPEEKMDVDDSEPLLPSNDKSDPVVSTEDVICTDEPETELSKIEKISEDKPKSSQQEKPSEGPPKAPKRTQKLTPATPRDKKPSVSPTPKPKNKTTDTENNSHQSVIKKATKPPIPPKKIGMKTSLKAEETSTEQTKKGLKDGNQEKVGVKEAVEKKEDSSENKKPSVLSKKSLKDTNEKDGKETSNKTESVTVNEIEKTAAEGNKKEEKSETETKSEEKSDEKSGKSEKKPERLVPCFQPDKCQIAPPTMASPSAIITPTISTPSTTPDLASSSTKNSQSIAAAPTTVTPSTLSSVSSTVVLTGNLARKEIEHRNKSRGPADSVQTDAGVVRAKEIQNPSLPEKTSGQMVKAASKDSIKWSNKDNLSGEITSATKVIKAEPDMEVLSPNNLRDSPPRIPPANVAWDEGRLPNGDVPNKAESEGKFRRLISTAWRFLSLLFCCRCFSGLKCCRKGNQSGPAKPSIFSKLKCKSCRNPFKCCTGGCKSKCCGGMKCCQKNEDPKPKSRKCCAKVNCSCKGCCDKIKTQCLNARYKINTICRSLFCLNFMCCQNFLRKFKFFHKFKCCQKSGFCSCCNPNVRREPRKLNKKGSRASNNSRDKNNLDVVLVEHTSLMKAAIPVLPSCLAVFCLILNLFVPGFGTFISGILCLCFGKPRFSVKDTPKNRVGSFILNTIIGVAQLFTVVFCLVGWGWSIWWGVIMYKLSRRQKRLKLAEKNQKESEGSNVNHNHVDVEQG